nr:defensin-like protein 1 [Ipomoea batatas]
MATSQLAKTNIFVPLLFCFLLIAAFEMETAEATCWVASKTWNRNCYNNMCKNWCDSQIQGPYYWKCEKACGKSYYSCGCYKNC